MEDCMMEQALDRLRGSTQRNLKATVELVVEEAVKLTGSTMAYLAVTDAPVKTLTMIAWSKTAMAQCSLMERPIVYPVEATGLWGDCIRERQAVITNAYDACTRPTKKGYTDGHVPVKRHMNVPIMEGQKIRGILGVGNKTASYTKKDAQTLQAFANAVWPIIAQAKARKSR
jgi:GAF domain-containing protein